MPLAAVALAVQLLLMAQPLPGYYGVRTKEQWRESAAGAGFTSIFLAYVFLGVLTITGISPLVLSIAGLFDSFFDFRKFNRKDHSDESHSD